MFLTWLANPRIKIQRMWLEAYRASFSRIATVEQLQLEQTDTHTNIQLYRIPRGATPRGIKTNNLLCGGIHAVSTVLSR